MRSGDTLALPKIAPYGSWKSPITSRVLAAGSTLPTELTIDGDRLYWLELHPQEGGRYALYRHLKDGPTEEVVPPEYNVRTRVHEYGGGSYFASGQILYFSNFADQLVYRLEAGGKPVPITRPGFRYADYVVDVRRGRLIGVCEDHTAKKALPDNSISSFATDGSSSSVLVSGNDFYSSPRIDSSGSKIAWVTWNFPNMPWDGTELWTGELTPAGAVVKKRIVAGGKEESVIQPEWSPGGALYFISDRSRFWNIYRWVDGKVERVSFVNFDIGRPQWSFRISTYAIESEERIVCVFTKEGVHHLAILDTVRRKLKPVMVPYTYISYLSARDGYAYFQGGSPTEPPSIVRLSLSDGKVKVVYRPKVRRIDANFLSTPRHIGFKTTGLKTAYGFLYPPKNRDYRAPKGERPPLIVVSHGGPTGAAAVYLNLGIQVWTSRGFAVLDVNYGGSTGYGREYRERLTGKWGIVDVDDCVNGAESLTRRGLVDGRRLIIRGGSAGGYTTLCALAFRKVFRAGASYFGVSDVEALAKETHKFESRYLDKLIAPYPEGKQVYRDRSAIHFPDRISAPMIFFQGLEDKVVSPSQAERMVRSLRKRGVPVAYIAFQGEQHGFRKAETIKRAFEAELYFYSKVFGFKLPERVEPVEIWNLNRKGD
jgi:dipeptidyl aminopeptidase/acylaminoacyl peptidase